MGVVNTIFQIYFSLTGLCISYGTQVTIKVCWSLVLINTIRTSLTLGGIFFRALRLSVPFCETAEQSRHKA